MVSLPLAGIRVIEMTEVWAGPMGTSLLGDLGAEVIRVESFPRASTTRPPVVPPSRRGFIETKEAMERPWDASATHNMANRNKLGIAMDLRSTEGLAAFLDLARVCDVVVEGYSAGSMERLGIHYEAVRKLRPDIIFLSMPGWGVQGPYRGYVTLGSGLDAYTGHWGLRCYPDSDPTEAVSIFHADAIAALAVAFAVISALRYRNLTGKGQWIDLSQAEAFLPNLARPIMDYSMNNRIATSVGNRSSTRAPQGVYQCRGEDQWIAISVRDDADWEALCHVTGDGEAARDPRFGDVLSRLKHQDELDIVIARWTSQQDKFEAMHALQEAGVPAGAVLDDANLLENPHLLSRDFFQALDHPVAGTHQHPGYLWRISDTQKDIRLPPNTLGQDNHHVFQDLLGRSPEDVEALYGAGVIGNSYSPGADVDSRVTS
ncbi:MAG: CoA transferase [Dehalococcoidia bacterium]